MIDATIYGDLCIYSTLYSMSILFQLYETESVCVLYHGQVFVDCSGISIQFFKILSSLALSALLAFFVEFLVFPFSVWDLLLRINH